MFSWLMTVGYPAEKMDGGGQRCRPPFDTMFFEKRVGNAFPRDPEVVKLLEDLNMLQPAGPLPGRLEELNKLTKRFGLGDEWLTDWQFEESQLGEIAGDRKFTHLSDEVVKASAAGASADPSGFTLTPTVKRERIEEYRKEKGIKD